MEQIPTAEEFLDLQHETVPSIEFDIRQVMIEFAKLHVKAALKEASEKSMVEADKDWIIESLTIYPRQLVDRVNIKVNKESILDSYPLENIK